MRVFPIVAVLGIIGWSVWHPEGVFHSRRSDAATSRSSQAVVQDFRWSGRIAVGNAIEVRGVNGDVRAMPASGAEVEVTAEKREGRRGDPDDVTVEVVEHGDGVTICAVYPSRSGENECRPGGGKMNVKDNDTKVDFTVRVPAGVRFRGHSVNGDVEARGLEGDVRAHTVNGSVQVSTSGFAEATTVNGSIRAEMGRVDWSGGLDFSTVNGSITVMLPGEVNAEVSASTVNGSIETDFPLTVSGRFSSKKMRGVIGSGGRDLHFQTVNGSIKLRRAS
jgi:hypothetical protein